MCGIAGIIEAEKPVGLQLVQRMSNALAHRGPDDAGTWLSPDRRVGLGHRRLAIIDLSPLGHQPMCSDDGQITIVFNGEIYNFKEVRAELQARGNCFRSAGDTEVVIAAYRTWGPACLDRLVGMFALAIWDGAKRRLFAARDRTGEKPLFYLCKNGRFTFASELKAIIVDPNIPRSVNRESLDDYLAYGYVSGSLCILDGFAKLPPGHWLTYEPDLDRLQISRYWDLPTRAADTARSDLQELTSELEVLLMQSVRCQLIADVPIGLMLSGGLDSSLVAAAAVRSSRHTISTFNVSFPGHPSFDESHHARRVADYLGSSHTELVGEPGSGEFLPSLIRQYDEPIADSSMLPTYLVSRAIRKKCAVALGGDGGDELFGGYSHHPWLQKIALLRKFGLHRLGLEVLAAKSIPLGTKGRNAIMGLLSWNEPQTALTRLLDPITRSRLTGWPMSVTPELRRAGLETVCCGIDAICATDFRSYLPDDILVKVDRASMLTSLEVRAPLLDHRIVEFAFGRLPGRFKVEDGRKKIILRALAQRWLPPDFDSHRKQGFSVPLHEWFQGPWRPLVADLIATGSPLFDKRFLARLLSRLRSTERGSLRLFQLMMVEMWRREYRVSAP
jgi:asparagine synthase (glutamine-hydrolysing)